MAVVQMGVSSEILEYLKPLRVVELVFQMPSHFKT